NFEIALYLCFTQHWIPIPLARRRPRRPMTDIPGRGRAGGGSYAEDAISQATNGRLAQEQNMSMHALAGTGSGPINLDHPGTYLHWSSFTVSAANLPLNPVIVVIFGAALLRPFPQRRSTT